jgi:RNA polymerase sigma factor (sigma-70 family)
MAYDLTEVPTEKLLKQASRPESGEVFARAVGELILRYKGLVYQQAVWVCSGNRSLADDVFQETFLRLFTWLKERKGKPPIHTFARLLRFFAKRAAIDLIRKENRQLPAPESEIDDRWEQQLYIAEILELVDSRSQEVLALTYFEGLSAIEIAGRLKLSTSHVRVLRFRALETIRTWRERDQLADLVEKL